MALCVWLLASLVAVVGMGPVRSLERQLGGAGWALLLPGAEISCKEMYVAEGGVRNVFWQPCCSLQVLPCCGVLQEALGELRVAKEISAGTSPASS